MDDLQLSHELSPTVQAVCDCGDLVTLRLSDVGEETGLTYVGRCSCGRSLVVSREPDKAIEYLKSLGDWEAQRGKVD